jgi:uncharacterized protein (DUF1330 family)
MTAYVISEVEILDEEKADRYRELASAAIQDHGGRYLVRGALPAALEGDWDQAERVVIVEFPSVEAAAAWYDSSAYAKALAVRHLALKRRLLLVAGI